MERLKLLAAHTILMGNKINPKAVAGLEMLVCENGKIEFLAANDPEIRDLTKRSELLQASWYAQLQSGVLAPKQE